LLYLLFFISGALGLVYEVLWMRRLTLLFGATTLAATATLSAFFLGLALGSAVFGARARTWRRPLVAFGLLEIGVGAGALLVPHVLDLYRALYPTLAATFGGSPASFAGVKLVLAMAAVAIPTFCMGGTLPALGEVVAPSGGRGLGVPVGGLYAANLLGATLGALAVPFLLLPRLGVDASSSVAVLGSVAVGLTACVWGWRTVRAPIIAISAAAAHPPAVDARAGRHVLLLAALSGAFTLALQTLWTRTFALVHENSIYSFTIVVVLFLVGLAGGAGLARAALRRGGQPESLLAWSWWVAGVSIVASPRLFYWLTDGLDYLPAGDWRSSLGRLLTVAIPTVLPATLALGMALPLLMERIGRDTHDTAGPALGRLLGVNTLGAILGPLAATFVIGPALGLWKSLALLGVAVFLAGDRQGASRGRAAAWAAMLAALVLLRPVGLPPVRIAPGESLISAHEGSHGTTAVIEDARDRWITVNNSYILGGTAAAGEERWQAHLPLLLHPSPRRVAFLGLGTGITAGAALLHPVERVLALEIVPEVVDAARADFAYANGALLDDARVTVVVDDGRNYMAAPPERFDVVVGDLLVPWRPGEAALYSLEHFQSVRRALRPGGLYCQWLPVYQLSLDQLAIVTRTFTDVFPQATLWRGNFLPDAPTLALVGHADGSALDAAGIDARTVTLAPHVDAASPFLKHPAGVWIFAVGALTPRAPWLGEDDGRRNRDREPWLELLGPQTRVPLAGAPLLTALDAAAAVPTAGTPLRDLDARHREWMGTGAALARASLERGEAGERAVFERLRTLPEELRRALGVDAPAR
jgi:spermidine synthase